MVKEDEKKGNQTAKQDNEHVLDADYTIQDYELSESVELCNTVNDFSKYDNLPYATWQELYHYYEKLMGRIPSIEELPYKDDIADFDIVDYLAWTGKPHTDRRTGKTEIVVFNGFRQKDKQFTILKEHPELIPPKIEVLKRKDKTFECNQQMQDDVSAIQQEIINVKSLVKEVVFKEQGIENVRVCDLATRHKDAFKAFLEEKELAFQTIRDKINFVTNEQRCPFTTPKGLLRYKQQFGEKITVSNRCALRDFFNFLSSELEFEYVNNFKIEEWKNALENLQARTVKDKQQKPVVKDYTDEEVKEYFSKLTPYQYRIMLVCMLGGMREYQCTSWLASDNKVIAFEDDDLIVYDARKFASGHKNLVYIWLPKVLKPYLSKTLNFPPKREITRKKDKSDRVSPRTFYDHVSIELSTGRKFSAKSPRKYSANVMHKMGGSEADIDEYQSRSVSITRRHYLDDFNPKYLEIVKKTHKYILNLIKWK